MISNKRVVLKTTIYHQTCHSSLFQTIPYYNLYSRCRAAGRCPVTYHPACRSESHCTKLYYLYCRIRAALHLIKLAHEASITRNNSKLNQWNVVTNYWLFALWFLHQVTIQAVAWVLKNSTRSEHNLMSENESNDKFHQQISCYQSRSGNRRKITDFACFADNA